MGDGTEGDLRSVAWAETAEGLVVGASLRDTSAQRQVESVLRSTLADVERLRDRLAAENVYLREETQRAGVWSL